MAIREVSGMCKSNRAKLRLVWSRTWNEARLCNVPMADLYMDSIARQVKGKFVGEVKLEETTLQLLLLQII